MGELLRERRITVLHVVESFGGGVAAALESYIRSTPGIEHKVLSREREGTAIGLQEFWDGKTVGKLPGDLVGAIAAVRRVVANLRPDLVHAHSSIAGGIVRLAMSKSRIPIVYTPHCFSFERTDQSRLVRGAEWITESLLARNTSAVAACSSREVSLSRRLRSGLDCVLVPNTVNGELPEDLGFAARSTDPRHKTVATMGRFCPQKDPRYFAATCSAARAIGVASRFLWIGNWTARRMLTGNPAIESTGWLPRRDALEELCRVDIYAHTAAWEGFPMTILEASAMGRPVVARAIPALEGAPKRWLAKSPTELATKVAALEQSEELRMECSDEWRRYLAKNSRAEQTKSLCMLYNAVLEKG